jgi:hypothetical protein
VAQPELICVKTGASQHLEFGFYKMGHLTILLFSFVVLD